MDCSWSMYSCKKWHPLTNKCSEVCLETRHCYPNKNCILDNSSFENIFSLNVFLIPGYNFVLVPNSLRAIEVQFGDVVGWTSNNTQCIQATKSQNQKVLFSFPNSNHSTSSIQENTTLNDISFSLRVHGFVPKDINFKFCHSQAETISIRSKIRNLVSKTETSRFDETVYIQTPLVYTRHKIPKFMVANQSYKVIMEAKAGTNLTCILKLPDRDLEYLPFSNGNQTEGIKCHKKVTFQKNGEVRITFKIFNLVSVKEVSEKTAVRIKVRGLRAFIRYSAFAYQNAITFYNTSVLQGDFVEYWWHFEGKDNPFVTTSTSAWHVFEKQGNVTVQLYAHNSASYEGFTIPTLVIPNPLYIQIPAYVKSGVPQGIACQVVWPEGTPQTFYQNFNLSGQRGADLPQKVDTILEFADGKSILMNANEQLVYNIFVRNDNKPQNITCTVKGHPDLSIKKSVIALDPISAVQIKSNCSKNISVLTTCKFQANFTGDWGQCGWAIRDKDGTFSDPSASCIIYYTFPRANHYKVSVNVSNQVSSVIENLTFEVYGHHISAVATSVTAIFPTKTVAMETPTLSTGISTPEVLFTSATTLETQSISPSSTHAFSSSASPNSTDAPPKLILLCASFGAVGQTLAFKAYLTSNLPSNYTWEVDRALVSATTRVLHHAFKSPGIYSVTTNVTSSHGRYSRTCRVTVQEMIMGFRITKLELLGELNVEIGFEVLQGTDVAYEVEFGEG